MDIKFNTKLKSFLINGFLPLFLFLIFIFFISYKILPLNGEIISYSDISYNWIDSSRNYCSTWVVSQLGSPAVAQIYSYFLYIVQSLSMFLVSLKNGDAYHCFFQYYFPIYLTCIIVYYSIFQISHNIIYSYFSGILIIFNNFILEQMLVWSGHFFYCLSALCLLFYIFWCINEYGLRVYYIAYIVLISFLEWHPFMLFIYVSLVILFLFIEFIFTKQFKYVSAIFLSVFLIIFTNFYWVLPFLYNLISSTAKQTHLGYVKGAYGAYYYTAGYVNFLNLLNYPMIANRSVFEYIHNSYQFLFNIIILFFVCTLLFIYNRKKNLVQYRLVLIFLFIYLFYFNLALGPKSVITGDIWKWAFDNLPGFLYFRSFTRFIIVTLISLIFAGAILLQNCKLRYHNIVLLALIVLNVTSYHIFISGTFKGLVNNFIVPHEYYDINNKYFQQNGSTPTFNILSFPHVPNESYTWIPDEKPDIRKISLFFQSKFFSSPVLVNHEAYYENLSIDEYEDVFSFHHKNVDISERFIEKINQLNVKYIIVHNDIVDTWKKNNIPVNPQKYNTVLSTNKSQFKIVERNSYFTLYENKNFFPILYGQNVTFQRIYDTKYRIKISNIDATSILTFLQRFNPNWNIYLDEYYAWDFREDFSYDFPTLSTAEYINKKSFFEGDELFYLLKSNSFENSHKEVHYFANQWKIDSQFILNHFPATFYCKNQDNSIDIKLTLIFKPQLLFYFGICISFICILILIIYVLIQRSKKHYL